MTSISAKQQAFSDKLISFGISTTNVNRILNQSITETLELVMIDNVHYSLMESWAQVTSGISSGQKMKIKVLWSWCRREYKLGNSVHYIKFVLQSNKKYNNKRWSGKNRK